MTFVTSRSWVTASTLACILLAVQPSSAFASGHRTEGYGDYNGDGRHSRQDISVLGPVADLYIANAELAPDGFSRTSVLANAEFPGPLITAVKGDTFKLNVHNKLDDPKFLRSTSIHWHGLFQHDSAWNDGPAFITQCPIIPGETFLYNFEIHEQTGTYWYHSHLSTQYCDGLRGPLVIYDPQDPYRKHYDVDDESTVITLADWYHLPSALEAEIAMSNSTLINGKGRYKDGPQTPLAVINVEHGKRYRMRLISISCDINWNFTIPGHELTIIEIDGVLTHPHTVTSLQIFSAQRYSFILHANQPIANYWMLANPNLGPTSFDGGINSAILRYRGAPYEDPVWDAKVIYGAVVNGTINGIRHLKEQDLKPLGSPANWKSGEERSHEKVGDDVDAKVDQDVKGDGDEDSTDQKYARRDIGIRHHQFSRPFHHHRHHHGHHHKRPTKLRREEPDPYRSLHPHQEHTYDLSPHSSPYADDSSQHYEGRDMYEPVGGLPFPGGADVNLLLHISYNNDTHRFEVNNKTFTPPTAPVLLQILSGRKKPEDLMPEGSLFVLPRGKTVEVTIPGGSPGSPHPFHLHGHTFDVVRSAGSESYNYVNPPRRDVVSTGFQGDNVTIRFKTDNPGPWIFHCHIDWHLDAGLAIVFAEGPQKLSTSGDPPESWDTLCPLYNQFAPVEPSRNAHIDQSSSKAAEP
ncbi:Cu-oxidase-domain-containing protein [Pluteus cervinus]|uniref:Cu-oxidase-domain-containing protein n=1 Tax=Pluteus cervinus TaxID=181527 RepID=A0ACD3AZJ0_9AGAR|nr:Cu-oxidase-domain-containing protein [Pluteus cervinus]